MNSTELLKIDSGPHRFNHSEYLQAMEDLHFEAPTSCEILKFPTFQQQCNQISDPSLGIQGKSFHLKSTALRRETQPCGYSINWWGSGADGQVSHDRLDDRH